MSSTTRRARVCTRRRSRDRLRSSRGPSSGGGSGRCGRTGQPRLLLVAPDAEPPADWDGCTDWVRLPVDDRDLCARVAALQRMASRCRSRRSTSSTSCGGATAGSRSAPIEARMLEVLLARCGSVVSRRELGSAAWPDGMPGTRAVDSRLRRLRDRVEPLGLQIHNVRRRGLMLEVADVSP